MMKKSELWLAFSGDELTCTVSVATARHNAQITIELAGTMTPERLCVYDLIIDAIKCTEYETVQLNVCGLVFFSGHTVNDCAIEQLLKLVCYFSQNQKTLHVLIEDGCVKDVLTNDLAGPKFGSVKISDSRSVDSHQLATARARRIERAAAR